MADSIGEIAIEITGDFSSFDSALQDSIIAAELGGSKVADAFNSASEASDAWASAMGRSRNATQEDVDAIGQATDSLNQYNSSIDNALGSEAHQLDLIQEMPKSYTEMTAAQQAAIDKLNQQTQAEAAAAAEGATLSGALKAFANTSIDAKTGSDSFLSSLMQFAGVALTLQGIKTAISDTISAYDRLDAISDSLTLLSGSADKAAAEISHLTVIAQDNALSLPAVFKADQNLRAMGISAEDSAKLLVAAADSSAVTGKSFDATSMAMERLVEGGMAGNRQLLNLGLTSKDLAAVMDVTSGEVSKMFKGLDEAARIDVVLAALAKFKNAAHDTSQDAMGDIQRLKNTLEIEFASMGTQLAPVIQQFAVFGTEVVHSFGDIIKNITAVGQSFGTLAPMAVEAFAAIAIAVRGSPLAALGLEMIQLGIAWRSMTDAQDLAAKSIQAASDSFGIFQIKAHQTFADFPEFASRLKTLDDEYAHGEVSQDQYRNSVLKLRDEFGRLHPELNASTTGAKSLVQELADLKAKFDSGGISQAQYAAEVKKVIAAHSEATTSTKNHVMALDELRVKNQEWTAEVNKAMAVVKQAEALDDSDVNRKTLIAEAIKQLTTVSKKYSDQVTDSLVIAIQDVATAQQQIDKADALQRALVNVAGSTGSYSLATREATGSLDKFLKSHDLLESDLVRMKNDLIPLGPLFKELGITAAESLDKAAAKAKEAASALGAFDQKISADGVNAWVNYTNAAKSAADAHSVVQTAAHAMGITTVQDLTSTRDRYIQLIADMKASGEGGWDAIRAAEQKVKELNQQILETTSPIIQAYKTLGIESTDQLRKDMEAKRAALEMLRSAGEFPGTIQKAQNALNEATDKYRAALTGVNQEHAKLPEVPGRIEAITKAWNDSSASIARYIAQMDAASQAFGDFEHATEARLQANAQGGTVLGGPAGSVHYLSGPTGAMGGGGPGTIGSGTRYPEEIINQQLQDDKPIPPGMKINATGTRLIPDTAASPPPSGSPTGKNNDPIYVYDPKNYDLTHMSWDQINQVLNQLQSNGMTYDQAVQAIGGTVTKNTAEVVNAVQLGTGVMTGGFGTTNTTLQTIASSATATVEKLGMIGPDIASMKATIDEEYKSRQDALKQVQSQIDSFNKSNQLSATPGAVGHFIGQAMPRTLSTEDMNVLNNVHTPAQRPPNIITINNPTFSDASVADRLVTQLKNMGLT